MDANITNTLLNMGFTRQEVDAYEYIYMNGGKFTPNFLMCNCGYSYDQAKRLSYMNKILSGRVQINTENDMIKHVKNMIGSSRQEAQQYVYSQSINSGYAQQNYSDLELTKHLRVANGQTRRIGMQDLAVSSITAVPMVAVVAGIQQEPFTIWNSNRYNGMQAMYKVVDSTGKKITVETKRKPVLKYRAAKKVPGVLEIVGLKQTGEVVVTFDKSVCRLCNRYIIVASLRRPEFHLGCFEIICFEGTKVYVYATNMGTGKNVKYREGTQRVYAYGIFPNTIKQKLKLEAQKIYNNLHGMRVNYVDQNSEYKVIPSNNADIVNEDTDEGLMV